MKAFLSKVKSKIACGLAMATTAVATVVTASAAEPSALSTHADAITAQFQTAANDIIPIIVGILGVGLGIFAIFQGIKLAKKMFGTVAK